MGVEVEVEAAALPLLSPSLFFSNLSPIDAPSAPPTPTPVTTRLMQRLSPAIALSERKRASERERQS